MSLFGTLLGSIGGNLLGGLLGSNASNKAANSQLQGQREANALQRGMYDQTREDYAPWREAGSSALSQLQALLANPQSITQTPGYDFRLNQGQQAIDRSAAARGNLYSGGTLKALDRFGQDYGTSEYGQQYNRLSNLAGLGQVGVQGTANAAGNYAQQGGNALSNMGDARASGAIGSANAWSNALGGSANALQQNALMQMLMQQNDPWAGSSLSNFFGGFGTSGD